MWMPSVWISSLYNRDKNSKFCLSNDFKNFRILYGASRNLNEFDEKILHFVFFASDCCSPSTGASTTGTSAVAGLAAGYIGWISGVRYKWYVILRKEKVCFINRNRYLMRRFQHQNSNVTFLHPFLSIMHLRPSLLHPAIVSIWV